MKTNKGVSEIISTILILLVVIIVVGLIIGGLLPEISKNQEKINFDNSIRVRDKIFNGIREVYSLPIDSSKGINISLNELTLDVNGEGNIIEVCFIGKFLKFFDDGKRIDEEQGKYTYRFGQKVCSGFLLENIDLIRNYTLNNMENTTIILKKISQNQIQAQIDNETGIDPNTQKKYVYDGE